MALLNEIYKHIRYPEVARNYRLQGKTTSKFIIGKDGKIEDFIVIKGLNIYFKTELLRVYRESLKNLTWTPGIKDGENVRVEFVLPVRFRLE